MDDFICFGKINPLFDKKTNEKYSKKLEETNMSIDKLNYLKKDYNMKDFKDKIKY